MLKEFRDFAMKGNVVDLAVGVIIGAAFGAIVTSLVNDVIMPLIGAIIGLITGGGGLDFSNYFLRLSSKIDPNVFNIADAKKQGAVLAWGSFLTLTLNFIIVAFVLFIVIRLMNRLKHQEAAAPAAPPKPTREEELLTEIRDLLKKT